MKRLVVFTMAIMFAMSGFAQEKRGKTPEERAEKITNKMKEKLNLTDDQVVKIQAINLDAAKKKEALKTEAKEKRKEMKEKVKTIETERNTLIEAVLTEDQKAEYGKMKEKGKDKMKKHRKHKKDKKSEEEGDQDDDE